MSKYNEKVINDVSVILGISPKLLIEQFDAIVKAQGNLSNYDFLEFEYIGDITKREPEKFWGEHYGQHLDITDAGIQKVIQYRLDKQLEKAKKG